MVQYFLTLCIITWLLELLNYVSHSMEMSSAISDNSCDNSSAYLDSTLSVIMSTDYKVIKYHFYKDAQ